MTIISFINGLQFYIIVLDDVYYFANWQSCEVVGQSSIFGV